MVGWAGLAELPPVDVEQVAAAAGEAQKQSWVPVAPLTGQVTVVHVCQPPVPPTAQVPTTAPVGLPSRTSIRPPAVAEATRAVNEPAPVPNAAPLTLM